MNLRFQTCFRRSRARRRGTTLIEVLAGLLLLGTLLVSITIARGRFIHQWKDAQRKLTAVRWADGQISEWLAGPATAVPVNAEGTLDAPAKCTWRTRHVPDASAAALGTALIRLEVLDRENGDSPLVLVDFLLPAAPIAASETP